MTGKEPEKEFMDKIIQNEDIIYKICNIYSPSYEDRQDLKQEIIYQLWRSYTSFRGDSKFQTWMYRVALNTAIYYNKKKVLLTTDLSNVEVEEEEGLKELEEQLRQLYLAIRTLNQLDRAIIFLYLEKRSYEQIGEITGTSTKNVSVRIVRIKEKLRQIIKKQVNNGKQ
jgi:RNA polymerase sigma-70 factor (ECF subfamily)